MLRILPGKTKVTMIEGNVTMEMFTARPGLPGHLAILLNEQFAFDTPRQAIRQLRDMIQDLRSEAYTSAYTSRWTTQNTRKRFVVTMNGGLDLFSGYGACSNLSCRVGYAEQIARSVALLADEVIMHDFLGEKLLAMDARRNSELISLLGDIMVLKVLSPLIRAELINFDAPFFSICAPCLAYTAHEIAEIADGIYEQYAKEFEVGRTESGTLYLNTGPLFTPSIFLYPPENLHQDDEAVVREAIAQCVRGSIFDLAAAAHLRGTVFSNSPVAMAAALASEGRFTNPEGLRSLDAQRAGALPWIRGLSVIQTLELRGSQGRASAIARISRDEFGVLCRQWKGQQRGRIYKRIARTG